MVLWRRAPESCIPALNPGARRGRGVTDMLELQIAPSSLDKFSDLLTLERIVRFSAAAEEARELTRDRVVWNISATAHGGGVAEMLQTLLAFVRGVHVDTRWLVLTGSPAFFRVTKRVHNMLHGDPGDGGALGPEELGVLHAEIPPTRSPIARGRFYDLCSGRLMRLSSPGRSMPRSGAVVRPCG